MGILASMFNTITCINEYLASATLVMIPAANAESLQSVVAKFQKKAAKMGCEPITMAVLPAFDTVMDQCVVREDQSGETQTKWVKVPQTMQGFSITGGMPKMPGYKLIGVLEFGLHGVIVREVPGCVVPAEFRTRTNTCDHCNKQRARTEVVVVQEEATGRTLQVGKSCCKDFLGHNITALYAGLEFQTVLDFTVSSLNEGGGGNGEGRILDTEYYLACVSAALRTSKDVFIPSRDTGSTRTGAASAYGLIQVKPQDRIPVTEDDLVRAHTWLTQAREHFQGRELTSYEYNMNLAVSYDAFSKSLAGIVASLPKYLGDVAVRQYAKKVEATSEYVGIVGKREDFCLTLLRTASFESDYGQVTVYTFADASGNVFVWKTGTGLVKPDGFMVGRGDTVVVKATVKKHDTYKDTKQTVLSRVAFVREVVQAAA